MGHARTIQRQSRANGTGSLAIAAAVATALLFTGGCQNKPQQSNYTPPRDSQLALKAPDPSKPQVLQPPSVLEAPAATQPTTADALAHRIQSFAQEIGPLTKPHVDAPQAAPFTAAEPSEVQFAKAAGQGPVVLPTKRPEPKVVDIPHPVVDNQPSSANESLSLTAQASASLPAGGMRVSPEDLNRSVAPPKPPAPGADLDAKFTKLLQDNPRELWAHLDYQLFHFLRDEQTPQLDALTTLPLEDRELVSAVMDGLTNFRNAVRADNNMLVSRKIQPILDVADRLRAQANLSIPTLALCTKVDGFGVYEPIDPVRFVAGKEHQAILYCEVENFACTPLSEKKTWETKLSQEATLYTESGMQVWIDKAGQVVDHSRNRRHDFYIVKRIKLPATLTIGRYLLKVTVEDQQAKRVAEQTVPIEIVAQLDQTAATDK